MKTHKEQYLGTGENPVSGAHLPPNFPGGLRQRGVCPPSVWVQNPTAAPSQGGASAASAANQESKQVQLTVENDL